MHETTIQILNTWLKQANYNISLIELKMQFLSHPDVGKLSSITDTLNHFNIANQAVQIDADSLIQFTESFIAFIKSDHIEQFVLVTPNAGNNVDIYNGKDNSFTLYWEEFKKLFGGIVVAIDKKEINKNPFKGMLHFLPIGIFSVSLCSILYIQMPFEIDTVAFLLLTFLGILFSAFLFAQSIGFNSDVINRFCSISKNTNCNSVLQSNAAQINKYINLTDVGIVYFTCQLLSILIMNQFSMLIYLISIPAATFSLYSIYQQGFVIKKWCPLCLAVVAVLILQGIVAIITLDITRIKNTEFLFIILVSTLTVISWYYLKGLHTTNRRILQIESDLLSFKRNYHLFLPFYKNERPFNDKDLREQNQIFIGNKNASICITLITNPLCEACQKAHKILTDLQSKYLEDVLLRLIFYIPYQNLNDPRTMISAWLIDAYKNNPNNGITLIEKWYTKPDLKAFDRLKLPKEVVSKYQRYLQKHSEWCVTNRLTLTPSLLINNKFFPLIYRTEDLLYHIESIIEFEQNRNDDSRESFQSTKVLVDNT